VVAVHAQPGARRDELSGLHGDRVRVRTTAPPVDGKANERIVEVVAAALGVARRDVELVAGATSRQKDLLVRGLEVEEARQRLAAALGTGS